MKRNLRIGLPVMAIGVALIVAGVLLVLSPWSTEEVVQEAAATPAEYGLCNVSVRNIPEDVNVGDVAWPKMMLQMAPQATPGPSGDLLTLMLSMPMPEGQSHTVYDPETGGWKDIRSRVIIDAQTGELVFENYRTAAEEAKIKAVLATLRVGPWQPIGPAWPRTDTAPTSEVAEPPGHPLNAGLKYREPERGSGMFAGTTEGTTFSRLSAYTCESIVEIDGFTGKILRKEVAPKEEAMFQRFLDEVEAPLVLTFSTRSGRK